MEKKINLTNTYERPWENEHNEKKIVTKDTKKKLSTLKDSFEKRKEVLKLKDKVWNRVENISQKIQTMDIPDNIKSMVDFNKLKPQFDKYINQIEDTNDIEKALNGIDNILIKVENIMDKVSKNPKDPKNISFDEISWLKDSFEKQYEEIIWDISLENKDKIKEILSIARTVVWFIISLIIWIYLWELTVSIWLWAVFAFSWLYVWNEIIWPKITKKLIKETTKNYILDKLDDKINDEYIDKEDFMKLYNFVYSNTDINNITNWNFENILSKYIEEYTNTYWKIKSETDFKKFINYAIMSFKNQK